MALEAPANRAMTDSAMIFPRAMLPRLAGVMSKVAMVPRSFSPAMASGATAIHPLKRKINSSIGIMEENTKPVASSCVARS